MIVGKKQITKVLTKKKHVTYVLRQSFPLYGLTVTVFETSYYPWGIQLCRRADSKELITLNARIGHDHSKFVEDLKESILEGLILCFKDLNKRRFQLIKQQCSLSLVE
ncbi:IQ motif and SEC7 domain-containing protein 1-like isoform X2 [Tachypleus tridentatus]|uniref:IQ motif and SEC7 domain-containing protein 1-like isoform X2 n=1 Tax=Tachypleus tridentatus TaxID=6853 RepID=UPI003FD27FDA